MEWFADSFKYFIKKGFQLIVIKPELSVAHYEKNYKIFKALGGKIILCNSSNIDNLIPQLNLNSNTLIFRSSYYGKSENLKKPIYKHSILELEIFYKLTKYNYENNCGSVSVTYFTGDVTFLDQDDISFYKEKTQYNDILIFPNKELKDYIFSNIPSLENQKLIYGHIVAPLKEYIRRREIKPADEKDYILLGRFLGNIENTEFIPVLQNTKYKIKYKFFKHIWNFIFGKIKYFQTSKKIVLSGGARYRRINKSRKEFFILNKKVFGLSHFYNRFNETQTFADLISSKENCNEQIPIKCIPPGQNMLLPKYYQFVNVAAKDFSYLMFGIIPLIPLPANTFYKELVDKKMAIAIETLDDFKRLKTISDKEINCYYQNIYENRDLFCFETTANKILDYLYLKQRGDYKKED